MCSSGLSTPSFCHCLPSNVFFWITNPHSLSIALNLVSCKLHNFPRSVRFVDTAQSVFRQYDFCEGFAKGWPEDSKVFVWTQLTWMYFGWDTQFSLCKEENPSQKTVEVTRNLDKSNFQFSFHGKEENELYKNNVSLPLPSLNPTVVKFWDKRVKR